MGNWLSFAIDFSFFNVAPWLFLGLMVLAISEETWAVYSFTALFLPFVLIMSSWPVMVLVHFGSAHRAFRVVSSLVVRASKWFVELVRRGYDFALGKFVLGLLVVHTVASTYQFLKYNLNVPELLKAAANLCVTILRYFRDYPLLVSAIQRWLRATCLLRLVQAMRAVWFYELKCLQNGGFLGLAFSAGVSAVLVVLALLVQGIAPAAYKKAFEPFRIPHPSSSSFSSSSSSSFSSALKAR